MLTGLGLVGPLGVGAMTTFRALLEGASIADRRSRLPDDIAPVDLVRAIGSVRSAQHTADDPTVEIAERVAREAAFEAGVELTDLPCHVGTSKGAIHRLLEAASDPVRHASVVAMGSCGHLSWALRQRLHLGIVQHHVAACSSGLTALHQARLQLLNNESDSSTDVLLVVSADSAMLPMLIHSYRRLGVLAPTSAQDYQGRPLDKKRCGFMLAQLGAAVVLKRVEKIKPGQIELLDTALATQPNDLIRPAKHMTVLTHLMQQFHSRHAIQMIHPHAPGTPDHDLAEMRAYADALADSSNHQQPCDVYAVKGALGHGLGAAGLVSLVVAAMCARTGRRPPMPWLEEPLTLADNGAFCRIQPKALNHAAQGAHAVFAAGFGGHVAGAVIKHHQANDS